MQTCCPACGHSYNIRRAPRKRRRYIQLPLGFLGVIDGTRFVYRLYDADGRLVYAGSTYDWNWRLRGHASTARWWTEIAYIIIAGYPSARDANIEERRALTTENPKFGAYAANTDPPISRDDDLLTAGDIARMLGIKRVSVRTYKSRGELPEPVATQLSMPRQSLWRLDDIEVWIESRALSQNGDRRRKRIIEVIG